MHFRQKEFFAGPSLVIGNGPSAKLLDFNSIWLKSITTVGMNSAYRFWDLVGFRPTYYICMDDVVIKNIADDVMRLVQEGKIKQFFLKDSIKEIYPDASLHKNIVWYSDMEASDPIFKNCQVTTGGWAIRWMLSKGCSYIATIGIDGINTEVLSESEKDESSGKLGLKVKETPKFNPNYFFPEYQQKGDKYQVPNNPGYLKARGRPFHEDALLSISRYMKEHSLDAKVVDLSPSSSHGIFPKVDLLTLKDKTSLSLLLDVESLGLDESKRILFEFQNKSLALSVYLILSEDANSGALDLKLINGVSVQVFRREQSIEEFARLVEIDGSSFNTVVLCRPFRQISNFLRAFQSLSIQDPGYSLIPVSTNQLTGFEILGAAFNLKNLVEVYKELPISILLSESCPAFLRLARNNIFSLQFSKSSLARKDAFNEVEEPTTEAIWSSFCEFSKNFPQLSITEETLLLFESKKVWLGNRANENIKTSLAKLLSFCPPTDAYFEVLTVKIDGPDLELNDSIVFKIESFIKSGGMIEWEVSGFGSYMSFSDFIERIKAKPALARLCANYPVQSFVNIDIATPDERVAHSDALLVIKYLLGEGKANMLGRPTIKSKKLSIDQRLKCPKGFQSFFDPVNLRKKTKEPFGVIYCSFGISKISSVTFYLKLLARNDDTLNLRICRDGSTSFEAQDFSVSVKKGINEISLSAKFSVIHLGCRFEIWGADTGENSLLILGIEAHGKEHFVEIKRGAFNETSASLQLPSDSKVSNEDYLKESNSVLAILDPDGVDLRGHYLAYDNKLAGSFGAKGIQTKILCRTDINLDSFASNDDRYIKCFDKHSWTIATNMELFRRELENGMSALAESVSYGSSILLYFYTGSVHHLSVLCDYAEFNKNVYIHLNLFWEMIRDLRAPEYASIIERVLNRIEGFQGRVVVSAPTTGVQRAIEEISGVELPIAPHPSTAVDDSELFTIKECLSDERKNNISLEKSEKSMLGTVVFPGASTIHKGYDLGLNSAFNLAQIGYECWVRDEPGYEYDYSDNIKFIPKQLSDEDFKKFLSRADVIVLPYEPEGFANRTSGLVIDALYLGIPVVVIEQTWLSEIVSCYELGICVDSKSDAILGAVQKIIGSSEYSRERLVDQAMVYWEKNSWSVLADFIINNFKFDVMNYKYANYLFRAGMYEESRTIYQFLRLINGYSLYERNIELCDLRLNGINGK